MEQLLNQKFLAENPSVLLIFLLFIIWTIVWKGLALWKASRKNHLGWFIVLLVLNTAGILEIFYFYFFSELKNHFSQNQSKNQNHFKNND